MSYGINVPVGNGPDRFDTINCQTCDREFSLITEGDTGAWYPLDEDNAPSDQPTKCDQCPYSHHMCGYCERDPRERSCPDPRECAECNSPVTSETYGAVCSARCEALSRGIA